MLWLSLSLAQLISCGTLFYLFSLLLEHFERDVSLTRVNAAPTFSIALLMEGVLGVMVCRLMGAGRAQVVMCVGSLLAGVGFAVMSIIQTQWQLYAAWGVCGVALSGVL